MNEARCPYCEEPWTGSESGPPADGIADCAACGRSFALAEAAATAAAAGPEAGLPVDAALPVEGAGPVARKSAPTDASSLLSGAIAAVVTVVFYLAIVLPLRQTGFGQLFADRGWVPYAITFLAAWSGVVLALKAWRLSGQVRALEFDLLPVQIAERITPDNAHVFSSYMRNLPGARGGHFLIERVQRALQFFRVRPSVREVVDQLRAQADADAEAVESSYSLLRVFIWAIPILGFIGTVSGIGDAVGAFSNAVGGAADLGVLQESIGSVTSGLGVAFDTTLLALVMSIAIMFPTSSLQRAEERFLAAVEEYCNEHVMRRMDDASLAAPGGAPDRALGERQIDLLQRLTDALEDVDQRLSKLEDRGRGPGSTGS
ncbi:MAG: MotA/TolQ/ExbB proton channel family protein [Myxococcota bacterium]